MGIQLLEIITNIKTKMISMDLSLQWEVSKKNIKAEFKLLLYSQLVRILHVILQAISRSSAL